MYDAQSVNAIMRYWCDERKHFVHNAGLRSTYKEPRDSFEADGAASRCKKRVSRPPVLLWKPQIVHG